jgi:homogentisate 1,2-dioxygenase
MQRGTSRVIFQTGAAERVAEEVEALGVARVLVVSTPGRKNDAAAIAARLGARAVGTLPIGKEHVPAEVLEEARREAERVNADAILAVGGGSAIGLAKAVALAGRVKVIAIPTTYSGSEMTPVYGVTTGAEKKTGRDERVRPSLVIYDPSLTMELPRDVTVASLWNALAHAVEALWTPADVATHASAEAAIGMIGRAVLRLSVEGRDADAREEALEGAYLAGLVFADAGAGLHHRLCHLLGGMFGLPHAGTHAALLPHVTRHQRDGAPAAMTSIARALGVIDAVAAIEHLSRATGAPASLEKLGMPRDGVAKATEAGAAKLGVESGALSAMLMAAWCGPSPRPAPTPLRAPAAVTTRSGFGSTHESEALPGALPHAQNAPRRAPYDLYPELLNGTPFTVRSAENSRVWMYRVRPSFSHAAFATLPSARFAAPLGDVNPNRRRWRPMPIPAAPARADFLDGLVTLGGAGEPQGPGWAVHLYAANADMDDRCFSDSDGDLLVVPQEGALDVRTELGWLRVAPGSILLVPRSLKFAVGLPEKRGRGFVLEVFGRRMRLPERGPIGSNGLADARHFLAPTASYEDRLCPAGYQQVTKIGGGLFEARMDHSPFDVVAWHGNHVPFMYDLSLFSPMGAVKFDHPDPSILTVLTAPLDDHGRSIADFVVFPGRWEVVEHSFRPPFMHRNAASEVNMVIKTPSPEHGYDPGCVFVSPMLTSHGVSTRTYDHILGLPADHVDPPNRIPDSSLWVMFESALPFRETAWARETPLVDAGFADQFTGMKKRFDPARP